MESGVINPEDGLQMCCAVLPRVATEALSPKCHPEGTLLGVLYPRSIGPHYAYLSSDVYIFLYLRLDLRLG